MQEARESIRLAQYYLHGSQVIGRKLNIQRQCFDCSTQYLAVTAESEATQNTETNKSEARGERTGREAASAKVGTSVELDSAADRSSRGTGSGEEGPSSRGAAPVPVVKDTLASVHGPSKKRIPLQCQASPMP